MQTEIQSLAKATQAKLSTKASDMYADEKVQEVIRQHQNQFPGSWQQWDEEERATAMARMLNTAAKKNEVYAGRIVLFHG